MRGPLLLLYTYVYVTLARRTHQTVSCCVPQESCVVVFVLVCFTQKDTDKSSPECVPKKLEGLVCLDCISPFSWFGNQTRVHFAFAFVFSGVQTHTGGCRSAT